MNDSPILRAAIAAKAYGIITGDRDSLDSGIVKSEIVSPAESIRKYS